MTFFRGLVILNILLVLMIGNFSCASVFQFNFRAVDDDLKPYVNEYHRHLDKYCPSKKYNNTSRYLIVKLDKKDFPESNWIGVCHKQVNGFTINIQREFFEKASEEERQQLINHEMSHCVLDKEHTPDINNYMYDTFLPRPVKMYDEQLISDIKERCK